MFHERHRVQTAQAGDLRRLLDMYERWHRAVAPALPYDTFLEDLEKMGQTHALKVRRASMLCNSGGRVKLRGAVRLAMGSFTRLCLEVETAQFTFRSPVSRSPDGWLWLPNCLDCSSL